MSKISLFFEFNKHALPPSLLGCLASLPLYFEVKSSGHSIFLEQFKHQLHLITFVEPDVTNTLVCAPKLKYFPVQTKEAILYVPQVVQASNYYAYSDLLQLSIRVNSQRAELSDNATFEYVYRPEKYSIPEITSSSLHSHMKTQIYTRYFRPNNFLTGEPNFVIDTYLPFMSVTNIFSGLSYTLSKYAVGFKAISPLTSQLVGCTQIPITTLLSELDHKIQDITNLLILVRQKRYTINFAGVGGTGVNTIYWLHTLCDLCNIENLFKQVNIFEKDSVDFSNIFRFPLPLSAYTHANGDSTKKVNLILPYASTLSNYVTTHDKFLETINDIPSTLLENEKLKRKVVTYGAPSIDNRNFLSSLGNFVSATHANNTASLWLNPVSDSNLQIETYGLIQLNSFFMNQISMAIEFLSILATPGALELQDTLWKDMTFLEGKKLQYSIDTELQAIPIDQD